MVLPPGRAARVIGKCAEGETYGLSIAALDRTRPLRVIDDGEMLVVVDGETRAQPPNKRSDPAACEQARDKAPRVIESRKWTGRS